MSIRLQIIIPLVLAILAGVGVSYVIARQAAEGQHVVAAVVEQALDARAKSGEVTLAVNGMYDDLAEVLRMTRFVPPQDVKARFERHDTALVTLLAQFASNSLSDELKSNVQTLADGYGAWREDLKAALGLARSAEIPTTEKLHREQQRVLADAAAVNALVGETAERKTEEANLALAGKIRGYLTMLGIGGAAALAVSLLLARQVTRPLLQVTAAMRELADGKTDIRLPKRGMTREINRMTEALQVFWQNEAERIRLESESSAAQLERRRYADEMGELIEQMSGMMDAAARGDFSGRVRAAFSFGELDMLSRNANSLIAAVETNLASILRVMTGLAEGDLNQRMQGESSGAFAALQTSVNSTFEKLSSLIMSIRSAADTVSRVSQDLRGSAEALALRTEDQANSLNAAGATLQAITDAVKQSEHRAGEAMARVGGARASSDESGHVVRDAIAAMSRIEQASGKIGAIMEMIDEIAFQTNLLALNAGVEAARAGPAGAGFAVVAQEVRALAQRATVAASEIKVLIGETREEVATGVGLVRATGTSLQVIQTEVAEIDDHVRSISANAREQSRGVIGVNGAVGRVEGLAHENADMVQKTVDAVSDLAVEANKLIQMISHFRTESNQAKLPRRQMKAA